jgi:hypothetical protein
VSLALQSSDRPAISGPDQSSRISPLTLARATGPNAGAVLPIAADPGLPPATHDQLRDLTRAIHGHVTERARRACVYLSLIARDVLIARGFKAHVQACTVSARSSRIAVGSRVGRGKAAPGERQGAVCAKWPGHLVCITGDVLIDLSVGQIVRRDLWPVFPMAALAELGQRPFSSGARLLAHLSLPDMPAGALLRRLDFATDTIMLDWHAAVGDGSWMQLPDADPQHRRDLVVRLLHGSTGQPGPG